MDYKPEPISTAHVRLSPRIVELTELLAKNTHDVWAKQRLSEGWQLGERRDDAGKLHPGLVAYDQLTESEKQYDRNTAIETIKAVLSMGYRIEPPALPVKKLEEPHSADADPRMKSALIPGGDLLPWDPVMLEDDRSNEDPICRRVVFFNRDAADLKRMQPGAIVQSKRNLLSEAEEASLSPGAKAVLERYAVADQLAIRFGQKTGRTFRDLFFVAFFAMTAFEFSGHGFPGESVHVGRPILLGLYLILWGVAAARYAVAWAGDYQSRHLDYRALAEGLRVQFFWQILGIRDAVDEHYLGHQRSELEWIRYALRTWRTHDEKTFAASEPESNGFHDLARTRWVRGQLNYFTHAAPAQQERDWKCRRDGRIFFGLNIAAVVALLLLPLIFHARSEHIAFLVAEGLLFVAAGIALVAAALRIAFREKMAFAEHAKEYAGIRAYYEKADNDLSAAETLEPYRELGKEALSENGDWLLTHRERPLEVPIP